MKKFILVLVLFLGMAVVVLSFGELENIGATLQKAHMRWMFLAIALECLWIVNTGLTYQSIYHLLGIEEDRDRLILVSVASTFMNIIAPTAGVSGIAVFVTEANRRGYPPGKATLAGALNIVVDQAAILSILAIGWVVLLRRNDLNAGEISASLLLLALSCIFAFLLYLGYRSSVTLGNILARAARLLNRIVRPFIHREYLSEERAHLFAKEIGEGLADLPDHSIHLLLRPVLHSLLSKVLLMGVLMCAFLAFDIPFSAGTIIAGWAISYLFLVVSPTPNGIGFVEGLMPLTLTSLRVPYEAAVVVTLFYRAVTFWFMLAAGAWSFRHLNFSESRRGPASIKG